MEFSTDTQSPFQWRKSTTGHRGTDIDLMVIYGGIRHDGKGNIVSDKDGRLGNVEKNVIFNSKRFKRWQSQQK